MNRSLLRFDFQRQRVLPARLGGYGGLNGVGAGCERNFQIRHGHSVETPFNRCGGIGFAVVKGESEKTACRHE